MKTITTKSQYINIDNLSTISLKLFLLCTTSFIIGRAFIFSYINPFMIPFLVININTKPRKFFASCLVVLISAYFKLSSYNNILETLSLMYFIKYTVAVLLLVATKLYLINTRTKISRFHKNLLSFSVTLLSCIIILFNDNFTLYYIISSLFESIFALILPSMLTRGILITTGNLSSRKSFFNVHDLISLSLVMVIMLIGLSNITFFHISLFITSLFLYLLIISYTYNSSISSMVCFLTLFLYSCLSTSMNYEFIMICTFSCIITGTLTVRNRLINIFVFFACILFCYLFIPSFYSDWLTLFLSFFVSSCIFIVIPSTTIYAVTSKLYEPQLQDFDTTVHYNEDYLQYAKSTELQLIHKYQNAFSNMARTYGGDTVAPIHNDNCEHCISLQEKVSVSKIILQEQLNATNAMLTNMTNNLIKNIPFYSDLSNKIVECFKENNLPYKDVIVSKDYNDKFLVTINNINQHTLLYSDEARILNLINTTLNKTMLKVDNNSNANKFVYTEKYNYNLSIGMAMATKGTSNVSGDSYTVIELNNGETVIALSDGMGSGNIAKRQSSRTLDLLDDFLLSEFDLTSSIKLINSMMMLHNGYSDFATLDVLNINKYTGVCTFTKIGSAESIIIRGNNQTRTIKSASLPIGILQEISIPTTRVNLTHNDTIVMITDGVIEANNTILDKEKWLLSIIQTCKSSQPQHIAEHIMKNIQKVDKEISDDMSIIVCKLI